MKAKKICKILVCVSLLCFTIVLVIFFMSNGESVPFKDKQFSRSITGCGENLVFSDEIHYYESCGNPVGSFDLCSTYSYNSKTKNIVVKCDGFKEKFKLLEYNSDGVLILEHDGETKIFYEDKFSYKDDFKGGDEFVVATQFSSYDTDCSENIELNHGLVEVTGRCNSSWLKNKVCSSYSYDSETNIMRMDCYDYDNGFDVYYINIKMREDDLFDFKINGKVYTYKSDLDLSDFDVIGNYSSKYVKEKVDITEDSFVVTSGIYKKIYKYKLYENNSNQLIYVYNDFGYSQWYIYDNYFDRIYTAKRSPEYLYRNGLDLGE